MQTVVSLPYEKPEPLPEWAEGDDRFPRVLAETFLRECSESGDAVLDPFAGFGTTLVAAEALERRGFGIEYDDRRAAHVRDRIADPDRLIEGDAFEVDLDPLPPIDLIVTSPPFMVQGMASNPFRNYTGTSDYATYLDDVGTVFDRLSGVLAPAGTVVVEVGNLKYAGEVTTLAWDVAEAIGGVLPFRGETVVSWTVPDHEDETQSNPDGEGSRGTYGYGYDHSYCLVFDRPSDTERTD